MKTVVVPTVQHTGSRLLARSILGMYKHQDMNREPVFPMSLYYDHLYPDRVDRFAELAGRFPTIIPLRHPLRCARSWERRSETMEYYFQQWEAVIYRIDPLNPTYICVDLKRREDDLKAIAALLGQELETIWPYVGEYENVLEPLENITDLRHQSEVDLFIAKHSDFFGRFYGN